MVQRIASTRQLAFSALADPTRRGVLEVLGAREASISELAVRFGMTLTGMKKHVAILEESGLVSTRKVGRVRKCRIGGRSLSEEAGWIEEYRRMWVARFDALDSVIEDIQQLERRDDKGDR